ncbi:FecCD family ABC transporter permease [Lacrimispora sp.]|uniref:FecCD family ABC transporter permease n=1 Tax=Lacrimispora sp. TaxID=2719234 RepID=UPI002FD9F81F
MEQTKNKILPGQMMWMLVLFLMASVLLSLLAGRYPISLASVVNALLGRSEDEQIIHIIYQVRMPRIFAAILVGGALSVSGAAYQGMFKNPLVSPDLLGASSGASFGAVLGIVLSVGIGGTKMMAFLFGLLAVMLTWFIAARIGKGNNTVFLLVLGGILVSGLFQSLITLMKYTADTDNKLPEITFWLMGSLNKATYRDVLGMVVPFSMCIGVLVICSNKINILSLGEDEAKALGVNTRLLQAVITISATVLTSYSISITGTIGWIGLIVPHLTRMIMGPNFKHVIPGSLLLGAVYLLLMDDLCRSLITIEIPLGITTSLVGIPFLIFLMSRRESSW